MDFCPGGRKELRRQLEENPAWESDLLALYGFDIWDAIDGRAPVRQAIALLGRLNHEPKSLWRAQQLGGPELKDYAPILGWDATTYVLADVFDAVNQNTAALVNIHSPEGSKPAELKPYPRPGHPETQAPKENLADFGNKLIHMFGTGIM